jgi:hypothetical protein
MPPPIASVCECGKPDPIRPTANAGKVRFMTVPAIRPTSRENDKIANIPAGKIPERKRYFSNHRTTAGKDMIASAICRRDPYQPENGDPIRAAYHQPRRKKPEMRR